jgi:hypothetical protein
VLDGNIDQSDAKSIPEGHPVDIFKKENRELEKVIKLIDNLINSLSQSHQESLIEHPFLMQLITQLNTLMDVDKHYRRKENLLFPFLEKKGITGPPTVMWGKHDEIRAALKASIEALHEASGATVSEMAEITNMLIRPAVKGVAEMIMKEEEILFPMTMDELTSAEWYEIQLQTSEIGYCLYDPAKEWTPDLSGETLENIKNEFTGGTIKLPSGSFSVDELAVLFNTLPVDITFVDKHDKVRFFTQGEHRIFDRNRAILGRDVRMCHPPHSMHIVDQILNDFKSGKEKAAPFWIQMGGKFIYINYFPLRDKDNNYLGTIEFSQDLTSLRALEGEQRLLSYGK